MSVGSNKSGQASSEPKIGTLPELVFAALLNFRRGTLRVVTGSFSHTPVPPHYCAAARFESFDPTYR
jgi:hypothetical protein